MPYLDVEQGNKDEVEEKIETTVPDVKGMTLTEAVKVLEEQQFEVKINNETEEMNKDEVIVNNQIPNPGITIYQGGCIYLN